MRTSLLLLLLTSACTLESPDELPTVFPCREDIDCADGFSCHPVFSTCSVPLDQAPPLDDLMPVPRDDDAVAPPPDAQVPADDEGDAPPEGAPVLVLQETFERAAGPPVWERVTFALDDEAYGQVVVTNDGCASALGDLDGTVVLSPSELNPAVEQVARDVDLRIDNQLAVRIASSPGCRLEVHVVARLP